jgi:hypothetical protein
VAHSAEVLDEAVAEALSGRRCVSAWLGYGNVLFLGFGAAVVPPRNAEGRRTEPPYELQTETAGWRVRDLDAACSDDERAPAERAIGKLIGRPVAHWQLSDRRSLRVDFAGGAILEVIPPSEDSPDSDEWWFFLPESRLVGVGGGGEVVSGRSDQPRGNSATPPTPFQPYHPARPS